MNEYNKPIHPIMLAEIFVNNEWVCAGMVFDSSMPEMHGIKTYRVCDEYNEFLYDVLFGVRPSKNFNYTTISHIPAINLLPDNISKQAEHALKSVVRDRENVVRGYFTLRDILSYNWEQAISKIVIVSEWQYKRLKNDGIWPTNLERRIVNPPSKLVSPFEMNAILSNSNLREPISYYVNIEHDAIAIQNKCDFFCKVSVPKLIQLIPNGGSVDDVRIVYSYDMH